MNSIHDMGGMHGFGLIVAEEEEPVFHAAWEGRVYAMVRVWYPWARYKSWGSFRHNLEKIPPSDYLKMSYYERWFYVHEPMFRQIFLYELRRLRPSSHKKKSLT